MFLSSDLPARPEGRLEVRIEGPSTCRLGKRPDLRVVLVNPDPEEVVLVGSLNGSAEARRFPLCLFEITGPGGESTVRPWAGCGNLNPIREKDFVTIPPKGEFDPFRRIDAYTFFSSGRLEPRNFPVAGEYRIRFVYDTTAEEIRRWEGDRRSRSEEECRRIEGLWGRVPRVRAESEEFRLTVIEGD